MSIYEQICLSRSCEAITFILTHIIIFQSSGVGSHNIYMPFTALALLSIPSAPYACVMVFHFVAVMIILPIARNY